MGITLINSWKENSDKNTKHETPVVSKKRPVMLFLTSEGFSNNIAVEYLFLMIVNMYSFPTF